ncbi:hypothetical protein [Spirosoma arcticum]
MIRKAHEFSKEDLEGCFADYHYQPELTSKLDASSGAFDQAVIQEIVLWKVNRYPILNQEIVTLLNELTKLRQGEHRDGKTVLEMLLAKQSKGIDLPMASTILRFRNPNVFQIIDRRAYRVLVNGKDIYDIYSATSQSRKVSTYFDYLDQLLAFCQDKDIPFSKADRILYQLDKRINKDVRLDGKPRASSDSAREGWEEQFRLASETQEDPDAEAKENEWLKSFENKQ